MPSTPSTAKFSPGSKSKIHDSERRDEILEMFNLGCRAVLLGELTAVDVADRICMEDDKLSARDVIGEIEDAVKEFEKKSVIPDVKVEDVEKILTDDKLKVEHLGMARRGIMALMFGLVKKLLMEPEQLAKIKPETLTKWFTWMRYEEDSERKLILLAQQNEIEYTKTKILFFRAIDGTLKPEDIDLIESDLRKDLLTLSDGGKLHGTTPGVQGPDVR